jgi:erythromycin esterase-like protein
VAEFTTAKVRLIKYLHQEMGFDVIAFESGLYECFQADRGGDTLTLAGFDIQASRVGQRTRGAFLERVVSAVDPEYGTQVRFHEDALTQEFESDPLLPLVTRQAVWSTLEWIDMAEAPRAEHCGSFNVRDPSMAGSE